jgi:putative ABC transport system permease protein
MMLKYGFILKESLKALSGTLFRTLLTMLGVIIGVAAVIAMMSIGKGAEQETLSQIRSLGMENMYIRAVRLTGKAFEEARQKLSSGLSREDLELILAKVPALKGGTFEIKVDRKVRFGKNEPQSNLIAVGSNYFEIVPCKMKFGRSLRRVDFERASRVVVIGERLSIDLFGNLNPVGKILTLDEMSFQIVGVVNNLQKKRSGIQSGEKIQIGERERDKDVYFPSSSYFGHFPLWLEDTNNSEESPDYAEVSTLILKLDEPEKMLLVRDYVAKILENRHRGVEDYKIVAALELLEKSQKVQEIFNLVMIFIAGLSLVVGGIGIMNIMLANIQQRVREIGIRRAVGATKHDILVQFLFESTAISFGGGLVGIALGLGISYSISHLTGWLTVISFSSIAVSFIVSVTVGLVFGIFPARKAAEMDPIAALRYE